MISQAHIKPSVNIEQKIYDFQEAVIHDALQVLSKPSNASNFLTFIKNHYPEFGELLDRDKKLVIESAKKELQAIQGIHYNKIGDQGNSVVSDSTRILLKIVGNKHKSHQEKVQFASNLFSSPELANDSNYTYGLEGGLLNSLQDQSIHDVHDFYSGTDLFDGTVVGGKKVKMVMYGKEATTKLAQQDDGTFEEVFTLEKITDKTPLIFTKEQAQLLAKEGVLANKLGQYLGLSIKHIIGFAALTNVEGLYRYIRSNQEFFENENWIYSLTITGCGIIILVGLILNKDEKEKKREINVLIPFLGIISFLLGAGNTMGKELGSMKLDDATLIQKFAHEVLYSSAHIPLEYRIGYVAMLIGVGVVGSYNITNQLSVSKLFGGRN